MIRKRTLFLAGAAGALVLAGAGLAAAKADNLLGGQRAEPAVDIRTPGPQDRLLAKAAYTQVLSHKAETLGMIAPQTLPAYAPVYPDGLILDQSLAPGQARGGTMQYVAAGPVPALVAFYEDAAAHHGLPFQVTPLTENMVVVRAADGKGRLVRARLTRQFDNGTQVDLTYN